MPLVEIAVETLAITLFGPMQVQVDGHILPSLRSRKALWVLALLTLRHGRPVEREWLAGTLWPDMDQSQAFANLRPVLSELRRALGDQGERLQSPDRHTLVLELKDTEADVLSFDAAIKRGKLSDLERAVALYQGPLLEGCTEEWVPQERALREQNCLQALQDLGNAALEAGNYGTAVSYFQRATGLDSWSDTTQRGWMEALAKSGDSNAAMQVYRKYVAHLRSDPTAVPDEQTTALYMRLRTEARQRNRSPIVITELAVAPAVPGYLPHPLTELVGREDERMEVVARLRRSRLVTLTGMGGIGKTRLALAVAQDVVKEYADGVWLVTLDALSEDKQVLSRIASVLGVKEEPGRSLLASVSQHLRNKRLLLVLDNCEHLLQASVQVVGHLLRECRELRVLATSREALEITGEVAWTVPALAVPDMTHLPTGQTTLLRVLPGYESVRLFVERAQAAQHSFALTGTNVRAVAAICADLEGIPLALELAAARVRALTVEQIAGRLDDVFGMSSGRSTQGQSRQQTLRATLDWSYALLSGAEGRLLGRLSVFAEGASLETVEQVCSDSKREREQILDLLTTLADKSLVAFVERETGGRYRLLEMVRQYAAEKLKNAGETDRVKARHRDHFLALAETAEPELTEGDQGVWLACLEAERANLRVALDWCRVGQDGTNAGLRLAGALSRFWEIHGHYSEGRAYLAEALARDGATERTKERARALNGAGVLAYYHGDYQAARELLEEGLAIFRELGNRQGAAWSLNDLGDVIGAQGDRNTARALYEESLATFRQLDHRQGVASLLHHLGGIVREQGDYEQARALCEESLAIFRELGNRQRAAWSLHHLGNVAKAQGDYGEAWFLQEEGLAIFRELGNHQGAGWALKELGDVAAAQKDREAARSLYEESLAIFRQLGVRQGVASLLNHLGIIASEQGAYDDARALYEESLTIFRELGNRQGVGWSLNGLGQVAFAQGDYALARTHYDAGIRILDELGDTRGVAEILVGVAAVKLAQGEVPPDRR
jgi:predicted ATPase/DNA-binding SARP family transcriptional activator